MLQPTSIMCWNCHTDIHVLVSAMVVSNGWRNNYRKRSLLKCTLFNLFFCSFHPSFRSLCEFCATCPFDIRRERVYDKEICIHHSGSCRIKFNSCDINYWSSNFKHQQKLLRAVRNAACSHNSFRVENACQLKEEKTICFMLV